MLKSPCLLWCTSAIPSASQLHCKHASVGQCLQHGVFYTSSSHGLQATCMKGMHASLHTELHLHTCVCGNAGANNSNPDRQDTTAVTAFMRRRQQHCTSTIASVPTGLGRSLHVLPIIECMQGAMGTHCTAMWTQRAPAAAAPRVHAGDACSENACHSVHAMGIARSSFPCTVACMGKAVRCLQPASAGILLGCDWGRHAHADADGVESTMLVIQEWREPAPVVCKCSARSAGSPIEHC